VVCPKLPIVPTLNRSKTATRQAPSLPVVGNLLPPRYFSALIPNHHQSPPTPSYPSLLYPTCFLHLQLPPFPFNLHLSLKDNCFSVSSAIMAAHKGAIPRPGEVACPDPAVHGSRMQLGGPGGRDPFGADGKLSTASSFFHLSSLMGMR